MATCEMHYLVGGKYLTLDQVNERLRSMSYRDRERFKQQHKLREHTLETWWDMSPSTQLKLCRALSEQRDNDDDAHMAHLDEMDRLRGDDLLDWLL